MNLCYNIYFKVSIFVITKGFIKILIKYGIIFSVVSNILIDVLSGCLISIMSRFW